MFHIEPKVFSSLPFGVESASHDDLWDLLILPIDIMTVMTVVLVHFNISFNCFVGILHIWGKVLSVFYW